MGLDRVRQANDKGATMWTAIFCALSVVLSLLALAGCVFVAARVEVLRASPQASMDSFESRLKSLRDLIAEQADAIESVANSVKMSRVRKAADPKQTKGSQGEPDPHTDPEGWRNWMNQQLRKPNTTRQ
jgi:hypothetical protein